MDADGVLIDEELPGEVSTGEVLTDEVLTDEELTALALAADPDAPIDDDAVPFGRTGDGLLPEWYMPAPQAGRASRGRRMVLAVVVVSLLALNGAGLCVTNGWVEIAW